MALIFKRSDGSELDFDNTLLHAGKESSAGDIELVQFIYFNFSEIVKNLLDRNDFPIDEGSPNNLLSCLSHFCYRVALFDVGFKSLRIIAYEEWYKSMLKHELDQDKRSIHKGMPLHQLGIFYLETRDRILAKKYFQLAYIEDVQEYSEDKRDTYISQAYRALRTEFRVPESELENLKKIVEDNKGDKYPERVLLKFIVDKKIYKNRATEDFSLAINKDYALRLIEEATVETNSGQKGEKFTRLVTYLFLTVGGFEVVGEDLITETGEHDFDILIRNMIINDSVFEEFGRYIISECKFIEDKKVGINELTKLLYKIKYHDCKCGVIFSRAGVAFDEEYNLTIKKSFNRDSVIILSVKEEEIRQVINGEKTFLSVLLSAYERVKFEVKSGATS